MYPLLILAVGIGLLRIAALGGHAPMIDLTVSYQYSTPMQLPYGGHSSAAALMATVGDNQGVTSVRFSILDCSS